MGYMRHHAIVVTSWSEAAIRQAHATASRIFPWVSPLSPEVVNGYRSFFVPPDGSKEGWDESDAGDRRRAEFKAWIREQDFDDGSNYLAWFEVGFGEDANDRGLEDWQGKRRRKALGG
jgi:hypothetical protein